MARPTPKQWRKHISEQQVRSLAEPACYRERQIDARYFCPRKQQLKAPTKSGIIRANVEVALSTPRSLYYQGAELKLGSGSVVWVPLLIRSWQHEIVRAL